MRRTISFGIKALVAGAVVVVILAIGMAFTIRRFEQLSASQVAQVHAEEAEINAAAHLRWSGEFIVSLGRGYLLSGNPGLLDELHEAESSFDRSLAELRTRALTPTVTGFVNEIERDAATFRRVQTELVTNRREAGVEAVSERFATELLPLYRTMERSLTQLMRHKQAELKGVYRQAEVDRNHVARSLYALLVVLALAGFAITSLSAARLNRAHRAEEQALSKARRALAARDQLMGVVAHDLRTPLGAITMKATLLRRAESLNDTRRNAATIENIAIRMEYLIKSLLDMSAMEAGQFSISPESCDVDALVRDAFEMFEGLARAKQIRLEQLTGDTELVAIADRERALQVLSNLLGNAIKFTPSGGAVSLSAERVGETVRFSVSDTGPGVSQEEAPHVFERFWRNGTAGLSGTGLGLFIAKNIVDRHGGRIWLESESGRGAAFRFTLPLADPARPAPGSPVAPHDSVAAP
jgi:signal transduction histidine kinase